MCVYTFIYTCLHLYMYCIYIYIYIFINIPNPKTQTTGREPLIPKPQNLNHELWTPNLQP